MMGENSFVEFWGRLGKVGGAGVDNSIQNDDIGEEEGEGEERVDMKKLAKAVDVKEIVKVLKVCELTQRRCSALNSDPPVLQNDKRYIVFEHVPEERERWIRVRLGVFFWCFAPTDSLARKGLRRKHEGTATLGSCPRKTVTRPISLRQLSTLYLPLTYTRLIALPRISRTLSSDRRVVTSEHAENSRYSYVLMRFPTSHTQPLGSRGLDPRGDAE